MDIPDRRPRFAGSWHGDAVLAVGLILGLVGYTAAQGDLHGLNNLLETCCGAGLCASIVARRGHPKTTALAAACLLLLSSLGNTASLPDAPYFVPLFAVAYSLGGADDVGWSALIMATLLACVQTANGIRVFNPFLLVAVIVPWAIGLAVGSRRRLTEQLAARSAELAAERELFAAEAVRYERARIARELHDIVAHCLSVMVIQASAGQRLVDQDPAGVTEAFNAIAESVRQAESETGRLVELLEHAPLRPGIDGILLVDELVGRATAAGLAVTCRFTGTVDGVSPPAAQAAYRVVQESLTNALRHAPGAPVDVVVARAHGELEVSITNGAPAGQPSGLELAGSGRGLAGMRERVHACGGELAAGPTDGGGWRVLARLQA